MFERLPLVAQPPGDVAQVVAAAEQAARHWDLEPPHLVRMGMNGALRSGDVILRVSRPTSPMALALRLADRLLTEGIRVVAPARADVVEFDDGLAVTAWERIDFDLEARIDWEQVGRMVAKVHRIEPSGVDHPLPYCADFPWWQFDEMM